MPQVWKYPGIVSWEGAAARSGTGGNIALRASVESGAVATGEREIAAHGHAFETRDRAQRLLRPLGEALARRLIGIARLRQTSERDPEMIGLEAERLLT